MKFKILTALAAAICLVSIVQVNAVSPTLTPEEYENHSLTEKSVEDFEYEEKEVLTDELIKQVTDQFLGQLVQEVDDQYRVIQYKTIGQLKHSFTHIASEKVVDEFVNFYYYEKDGELYIVPTSTPPWFDQSNEYELKEIEENVFEVKQYNLSEYYGEYTIVFVIRLNDGDEPFIIDVNYL